MPHHDRAGWVATHLPLRVTDWRSAEGYARSDLMQLALRDNPRRAHLIVSPVLGKHVPCEPRLVREAGSRLGRLVTEALAESLSDGDTGSRPVVFGFAETATSLAHLVADEVGCPVLHSTRSPGGLVSVVSFEESHSHATQHEVVPEDTDLLAGPGPLIIVDDELSTGRTLRAALLAILARWPRRSCVVASLLDLRTDAARDALADELADLGVELHSVSLGRLQVDAGNVSAASALERAGRAPGAPSPLKSTASVLAPGVWQPASPLSLPSTVRASGRHGFCEADRDALRDACAHLARLVLERTRAEDPIHVLGTEELMYAPLVLAECLQREAPGRRITFSSTTRSPVSVVDDDAYAIRHGLAYDVPGHGRRFVYNLDPADGTIVVMHDDRAAYAPLAAALAPLGAAVIEVAATRLHSGPSLPAPLRGPRFGSYAPEDVDWLLTDLSHVQLERPVGEREAGFRAGEHYSASLPTEYEPDDAYLALFHEALAGCAGSVARAVACLGERLRDHRGDDVVLASLARAGTPIGVLLRRWWAQAGLAPPPHATISIVRGRGIDLQALRYLERRHGSARVVFVDGWTGKGAITRELQQAVADANERLGTAFDPGLAVVADPAGTARWAGVRDDLLVPSALLNSTVSGLVSRTVLRPDLTGPRGYHGAKCYAHLAEHDLSRTFVDVVSARFPAVAAAREDSHRIAAAESDEPPVADAWQRVADIARRYGLKDLNLVKPGIAEATRVLLRRVPWQVLVRSDLLEDPSLAHIHRLAAERDVPIIADEGLSFGVVALISPGGAADRSAPWSPGAGSL